MTSADIVTRAIDAFERLGTPYMVVGSFSSNVYGRPRSTKDADFVVELGDTSVVDVAREIGPEFVVDPQMSFETITATACSRIRHRDTAFTIEIFSPGADPHDRERFARRVEVPLGGRRAFVPTAEDVVITKLRWSRQGKRRKDLDDARDVLAVQAGALDFGYIERWCDAHGTRELLDELRREVEQL